MLEPSLPLLLALVGYGAGLWVFSTLGDIIARSLNFRWKKLVIILLFATGIAVSIGMFELAQRNIACFPECFPRTYPLVMMPVSLALLRWSDQDSAKKYLSCKSSRLRFIAIVSLPIIFVSMSADLLIALTAFMAFRSVQDLFLKIYRARKRRSIAERTA